MARTQFTGLAGEFFVCYQLASRGYHVALTRGNAPQVDVLVSSVDGSRLLAIQVKTMQDAWRHSRNPERQRWEWPVSPVSKWKSEPTVFAFVDLETEKVFLVPGKDVKEAIKNVKNNRPYFWIYETGPKTGYCAGSTKEKYFERWDRIANFVGPPSA